MSNTKSDYWSVIGQPRAVHFLQTTLQRSSLASAYLFFGPNAVGKKTIAKDFLQAVLCTALIGAHPCGRCASCRAWIRGLHPDTVVLTPQVSGEISVESVRALQQHIRYRPTLSRFRTAFIDGAESLTQAAAHALLKTLEEPPEQTVIVLTTESQSRLPLTVRSRCQELAFHLVGQHDIYRLLLRHTKDTELAVDISHCAVGRPGIALRFLTDETEYAAYQERVRLLLSALSLPVHERLREFAHLLPKSGAGVREASWPLLDIMLWLLRDAALVNEHAGQFLVYRFLRPSLEKFARRCSTGHLLDLFARLADLKQKLQGNVNPALGFESFLVNV